MRVEKFFDENAGCWAVRYGDEIEYFNHETPEHDEINAEACFKLLQKSIKERNLCQKT